MRSVCIYYISLKIKDFFDSYKDMYTQQDQQYIFYRGDASKYTFDDKFNKRNYLRFDNVYPNFVKCDNYCKNCDRTINNDNCIKCANCLKFGPKKPKLESISNIVPQIPKEPPLIPFPFYESLLEKKCGGDFKRPSHVAYSMSDISCSYYCSKELCDSWEKRKQLFEDCKKTNNNEQCRAKYGCKQWEGWRYRFTAPLPPFMTDCKLCWEQNYTNI